MDIETHTPDEIDAANNLINLNNTVYMNNYLYHPNREIRNHNRTIVAIEISNYLKLNNKQWQITITITINQTYNDNDNA